LGVRGCVAGPAARHGNAVGLVLAAAADHHVVLAEAADEVEVSLQPERPRERQLAEPVDARQEVGLFRCQLLEVEDVLVAFDLAAVVHIRFVRGVVALHHVHRGALHLQLLQREHHLARGELEGRRCGRRRDRGGCRQHRHRPGAPSLEDHAADARLLVIACD